MAASKFTGKYLCQSLFFHKNAGLRSAILLGKRLWHRCFPVNFAKFLRTPFLKEHLWWLLLNLQESAFARAFFSKYAGLRPAILLKKTLWRRCFSLLIFCKIFKNSFFYRTPPVAASEMGYIFNIELLLAL